MYVCYWTLCWTLIWQTIQESTPLAVNSSQTVTRHVRHNHCSPGTYNRQRTCVPCSRCEEESFEVHPCSLRRDTVCQSCGSVVHAPSVDFLIKCQVYNKYYQRPPEVTTVTTTPEPPSLHLPLQAEEISPGFTESDNSTDIQNARQLALFQGFVFLTVVSVVIGATCKSRLCVHEFHLVAKQDEACLIKNNDDPA